jgi:hypothetical protein
VSADCHPAPRVRLAQRIGPHPRVVSYQSRPQIEQ